jgi:hypothetical protein
MPASESWSHARMGGNFFERTTAMRDFSYFVVYLALIAAFFAAAYGRE